MPPDPSALTDDSPHSFGPYRVLVQPGDVPDLILSIAGIGDPVADKMNFEWRAGFAEAGRREHILYVQDRARSWFNRRDGYDDLIAFIKAYIAEHHIRRTTALGLSMGASGCFILDADLRFDKVVALSPQVAIGRDAAPWDVRFQSLWASLPEVIHPDLRRFVRSDGDYDLLVTLDDAMDLAHIDALCHDGPLPASVRLLGVRGHHNIGSEFRKQGLMTPFLKACATGRVPSMKVPFLQVPDALTQLAGRLARTPDESDRASAIAAYIAQGHRLLPEAWIRAHYLDTLDPADPKPYPLHGTQRVTPDATPDIFVEGWSVKPGRNVWSVGEHHHIRFDIIDHDLYADVRCKIVATALLADNHPTQRVRITTPQGFDWATQVHHGAENRFSVTLPCHGPTVDIFIDTPDHMSPKALGINADPRALGIMISSIALLGRSLKPILPEVPL